MLLSTNAVRLSLNFGKMSAAVSCQVRQKHRVYIQKPYPRPKLMKVIEDLSQPILGLESKKPAMQPCELPKLRSRDQQLTEYELFLARRLTQMFEKASSQNGMVTAFHPPSVNGRDWREIRIKFQRHGIELRVFHPRVVTDVLCRTKYANLAQLLPAPLVLGFSSEPRTMELMKALKMCPSMQLLACCVYDRMLSCGQVEALNELGSNSTDLVAQSMAITKSIPASLSMTILSSYSGTSRILKAHIENQQKATTAAAQK